MVSSAVLLFTTGAFALQASRPNVLFIVVDDLGVATSNYGFPAAAPNLEALAARSTQFSRAYVSMAVCAPSRTAFLTGMRPDTTRVWTIGPYFRTSAENGMNITTLPQLFRRNGYITSGSGKIFHPGQASGGVSSSEGGGDACAPPPRRQTTAATPRSPTWTPWGAGRGRTSFATSIRTIPCKARRCSSGAARGRTGQAAARAACRVMPVCSASSVRRHGSEWAGMGCGGLPR